MQEEKTIHTALMRLEKLLRQGALTQQAYIAKKNELLAQLDETRSDVSFPTAHSVHSTRELNAVEVLQPLSSDKIKELIDDVDTKVLGRQASLHTKGSLLRVQRSPAHQVDKPSPYILVPGQVVRDRYLVKKILGTGGMGQVCLVEDQLLGDQFALKQLHPWILSHSETASSMIREFQMAQRLKHPGIVSMYNIDKLPETGQLFYLMEYVEGVNLQGMVDTLHEEGKSFRIDEAFPILSSLSEILVYAHSEGVVHRDLKPANIMLTYENQVKLVDFGLAKAFNTTNNPVFHTGHNGTFYYIAPEQLVGGQIVTPSADIFSLGVIAYQLLTGELPVAMALPPSELNPQLPNAVDPVIRQAMHPRPSQRTKSAKEFIEQLRSALFSTQSTSQTPTSSPPATSKPVSTTPSPKSFKRTRLPSSSIVKRRHESRKKKQELKPTPYLYMKEQSNKLYQQSGSSLPLLSTWRAGQGGILSMAVSPDGKLMVSGGEDESLQLWEVASGYQLHTLSQRAGRPNVIRWSPNGRFICVSCGDNTLKIWELFSANPVRVLEHDHPIFDFVWSKDGETIMSIDQSHMVNIWELEANQWQYKLTDHPSGKAMAPILAMGLDTHEDILYSASANALVYVWDTAQKKLFHTFEENFSAISPINFAPNHDFIAFSTMDNELILWDFKLKKGFHMPNGHYGQLNALQFSPDSRYLVSSGEDKTLKLWKMPQGELLFTYRHDQQNVNCLTFDMSGKVLFTGGADSTIKLWEVR
ncbi:MAG TPA: hypothetical protein DCE42_06090, partial [Myxococcales bacterium]|nr:hypothetical protein [Myxococcales bacterium]